MLDINLRVFLKQNPSLVGTTKEVIYNQNGKTMFKVEWDRSTCLSQQSQQTVFDVRYISELYTHKSLSIVERNRLVSERNKIIDSNLFNRNTKCNIKLSTTPTRKYNKSLCFQKRSRAVCNTTTRGFMVTKHAGLTDDGQIQTSL
jgi:hypothetical protein